MEKIVFFNLRFLSYEKGGGLHSHSLPKMLYNYSYYVYKVFKRESD